MNAEDALLGTPYQTVRLLGQGGMGVVYEATHKALKKRVVVKLLHDRYASQPHLVDRMRLEAQALAGLSSPHLVQVHDLGETATGQPYFVMELLDGRTLAQRLASGGALGIEASADIARQLLRGLAVAHAAGIVHRDIKPENIFLCERPGEAPLVKILDFGIAKVLESGDPAGPAPLAFPTEEGAVLGTPRYLSPEQAKGLKVDLRADLYSVGLVMFAMLTGTRPFEGVRDYLDLVRAHAEEPPVAPGKVATEPIPAELDQAVLKAMQKEPSARFESALAFEQAIAKAMRAAAAREAERRASTPPAAAPRTPPPTMRMESAAGATPSEPPVRPTPLPASSPGEATDPVSLPLVQPARVSATVAVLAVVLAVGTAVALTFVAHAQWGTP